jgi:serine/threonine protein phosphatase PrpC
MPRPTPPDLFSFRRDAERDYSGTFESPADADTGQTFPPTSSSSSLTHLMVASIPVLPGDIIILATDGLYDNIDLSMPSLPPPS